METVEPMFGESPLEILARCGGYYECPKDERGRRLGSLVGYAGRDASGRQYVGDVYVNFAKAERHAPVLGHFARGLLSKFDGCPTGFIGAPEGGKALALALALELGVQYVFPEKKVRALATPTSRELSELVFDRHDPEGGEWWIVEDVCNNFSTTAKLVALVEGCGASVGGVLCFLNRSLGVDEVYAPRPGLELSVVALVRKPIKQYAQDDPHVAEDVRAGNVVWKPKNEWHRLDAAMVGLC